MKRLDAIRERVERVYFRAVALDDREWLVARVASLEKALRDAVETVDVWADRILESAIQQDLSEWRAALAELDELEE